MSHLKLSAFIQLFTEADVNSVSFILNRGESMSRCSQCKTAQYCSVQCQVRALHTRNVKCLKRLQPRTPTDSVHLVRLSIIFKLVCDIRSLQTHSKSVLKLPQGLRLFYRHKKEGLRRLCTTLQVYLGEENHDLSQLPRPRQPPRLSLSSVTWNCFSIGDGELQDVGVGLYPSAADCNSPCLLMFQALTISYIDIFATSKEKLLHLQEQYHFLCQCSRCSTEDKDCDMLAEEKMALTSLREQLQSEQRWEELLQESQSLLHKYADVVLDRNVYVLRLLDLAMDACICLDDFETVLEYSNRALESYKLIYSDPHPSRAVELLRLGKLQHYLSRLEEAQGSFTQAYDIMKVTHRMDRTLTNEVRRKLSECQAELGRV
uniref:[histone H3]-lysine(4) N-trimethyltransferase n=2 Tax=Cyprinus carpio TaxID=7962 RepID=A0A8C1CGV5_CYPCA